MASTSNHILCEVQNTDLDIINCSEKQGEDQENIVPNNTGPTVYKVWEDVLTYFLIDIWEEHLFEFRKPGRNYLVYKAIAKKFNETSDKIGLLSPRTEKEITFKIRSLTTIYQRNFKIYSSTGSKPCPWKFYQKIHKFYGAQAVNDTTLKRQSSIRVAVRPIDNSSDVQQPQVHSDGLPLLEMSLETVCQSSMIVNENTNVPSTSTQVDGSKTEISNSSMSQTQNGIGAGSICTSTPRKKRKRSEQVSIESNYLLEYLKKQNTYREKSLKIKEEILKMHVERKRNYTERTEKFNAQLAKQTEMFSRFEKKMEEKNKLLENKIDLILSLLQIKMHVERKLNYTEGTEEFNAQLAKQTEMFSRFEKKMEEKNKLLENKIDLILSLLQTDK